ncbi:unnamed protein product [Urochloa decumbens]|uniref:DUF674 domain-containing protein n=1 Tax=Urochloa decumbens TaxID=240449 RepID=A0ABC8ZB38_9POAL
MATTAAALSMKLLIDTKSQRVLFAEAGKDVADFLFSLLALPVATAVKLVGKNAMVGSVGNLYASVDNLESTYVQPDAAKDALLRPPVASANISLLRLPEPPSSGQQPNTLYRCTNTYNISCRSYVAGTYGKPCPSCNYAMTTAANYLPPSGSGASSGSQAAAKWFVQGIVTYTVTDDLTVTPMSAISGITLLNTFGVRDLADLHEKTVQLGNDEGLAILKASLESKNVLTDVFLGNNKQQAAGASHV